MSTPVTYIGNSYSVPAYQDTGFAQGSGNLSSYLIALATGSLTLSGGTFPLTADANFGGSFGLVALYLKSRGASLPTAGFIRMANAEAVAWKNAAGGGNISLTVNSSDQLSYDGGDMTTTTAGKGLIVKTPDGNHTYRLGIDNDGNFTTEQIS